MILNIVRLVSVLISNEGKPTLAGGKKTNPQGTATLKTAREQTFGFGIIFRLEMHID